MAKIQVNGKFIEAKEGSLLIDVLLENNIHVPHFCYHKSLGKDGNCRMCMVEIEGQKRPQIACDTPVKEGQVIRTKGEKIDKVKKNILELELINHPIDCPICDQAGECKLQDYYMDVGLYDSRVETSKQRAKKQVDLGSFVMLDQERCVLCTRCVRFTKNITKTHELGVLKRADSSVIATFPGKKLDNPYAMNVVDLCPVGALTSKDFRFKKRVWFLQSDEIICDGCSKGCNIFCDHNREKYGDDLIYRYRPRLNEDVNGHFICDVGRLSYKKENENRLYESKIQGKDEDFETALKKAQSIMGEDKKKLLIVSPNLSIEEMYLLKLVSEKFNCDVVICMDEYKDENFGDDFLKQNNLGLNANGALVLGLDTNSNVKELLKNYDLHIYVGLKNLDAWIDLSCKREKTCCAFSAFGAQSMDKCAFLIAIASHTEKKGTYLTSDNLLQKSNSKVRKNKQAKSLFHILSRLGKFPFENGDDIWDNGYLDLFSSFKKAYK
ncbi:MAG: NADH-quinone oxidoreductase subunit G [Proteobacteria bacterium]|nr:MAG: NADH-quinone oxidoreductase subunit G [Pseudomonadota bacterium]